MSEEQEEQEVPVQPEDPEYHLEQHITFRRKQEVLDATLTNLITKNLTDFKPIMNGTAYSYTTLKIRNSGIKELTQVIQEYEHLRVIDFGFNLIKDVGPLLGLKYITHLGLTRNLITSIGFLSRENILPYLREVNLLGNKIEKLPAILVKNLRKINLNLNLIFSTEEFTGHPLLQVIELQGNKLTSLQGLSNLPQLQELNIAENELTSIKEVSKVGNLKKLGLSKNKIQNLSEFPVMESLCFLDIRENLISKVEELRGVGDSVKNINLLENPIEKELGENTKQEVWMRFRNFNTINESDITEEERESFDKEYKVRLEDQERERIEREQAEREAQEQENAEKE